MLNALQPSMSPSGAAFRVRTASSQDSQGGIGILPGAPAGAVRGRVALLLEGSSLQAAILETIHEARTSVKADLHLLRGPEGQEIARALARRARQGLRVQILAWGPQSQAFDDVIQAARDLGLVVRRGAAVGANPVGKALIADDRVALVGAIGGPAATRGRRGLLRLAGEAAWELGRQFNHDWAQAGGHPLPLPDMAALGFSAAGAAITVGGVGPSRKAARAVVMQALRRARRSIEVMVDAIDDPEAIAALAEARRRGVAVRVVLAGDAADVGGRLARTGAIAALAAAGVPVRLHQAGGAGAAMAVRAAVVDGGTLVMGSAPWTRGGLAGGGEVVVEVKGDGAAALMRETFERDWEAAAPAPLPTAVRRVAAVVAPALEALSRVMAGRRWAMPDLRVGVVTMAGKRKLVVDVR
jgi:phosphatidylserine/phosphatidylglycerophosphate/cardiolipin synthase-like enzyme